MLSNHSLNSTIQQSEVPQVPSKWKRNPREDMKEAINLFFKFKEDLEKLHPECKNIIERMLQIR